MMDSASLKSMVKMIKLMLPYEYGYHPETSPSKAVGEIFDAMKEENSSIGEMEPFLGSVMKNIDQSEDTSKLDRTLMRIWKIIGKWYPPVEIPT